MFNRVIKLFCCFLVSSMFLLHGMEQKTLHTAVRDCDTSAVRQLLESGVDVNLQDNNGKTRLHQAVINGNEKMVRLLLDAHAQIDIQDVYWWTPLHYAAYNGNQEVVKMLVEAHANVDLVDSISCAPIYYAIREKHIKVADILLSAHANVKTRDNAVLTPLHMAVDIDNQEALILAKKLLCAGADANAQYKCNDWHCPTALHIAVEHGNQEMVNMLLDVNADTYVKDLCNTTPLQVAQYRHFDAIAYMILLHQARQSTHSLLSTCHSRLGAQFKIARMIHENVYKKIYEYLKEDAKITSNLPSKKKDLMLRYPKVSCLLISCKWLLAQRDQFRRQTK